MVADGAIAHSKISGLTTALAAKLNLTGGTVSGTLNIDTLNVTGVSI